MDNLPKQLSNIPKKIVLKGKSIIPRKIQNTYKCAIDKRKCKNKSRNKCRKRCKCTIDTRKCGSKSKKM